ncbi:MAG: hypothetical protein ACJARZ_000285 [Dokdonia sp.]|jgi:hypothetical protein
MEDGSLYRSVVDNQSTLAYPGNTGRIEHLDWDGNLIWAATISSTDASFHHDFVVLENGNILLLVAERMSDTEAIAQGRDPLTMSTNELYEETAIEIQPQGTSDYTIVWEWRAWDHLVQDFDATKANFGIVGDHPELLDFNFGTSLGEADWLHSNSMSYNVERDQISISNRNLDEFIIIDHSTTTAEAATSSGGLSNRGGDILYRYGNPASYKQGTVDDQVLSAMHDVHFITAGFPDAGKIQIFNNGPDFGFTAIQIIDPEFDTTTNNYVYDGGAYGPDTIDFEYTDPTDPTNFFASFLSGSQQLPNGNILIANGPFGFLFEVTPDGETVWEYQSPLGNSQILSDGEDAADFQTRLFRALRYAPDYAAFDGRDLTPTGVIEQNPAADGCELLSTEAFTAIAITMYPNPTTDFLTVQGTDTESRFEIYDLNGRQLSSHSETRIDVRTLSAGIYLLQIHSDQQTSIRKFIKK